MRRSSVHSVVLAIMLIVLAQPDRASAIGWDSDDFLIGGGSNFTTRIAVYDHDLTFKGLLDSSFLTVSGMDFDAAGHLVAVAPDLREVRVYDSTGGRVGGFVRSDDALAGAGDFKVAADGSYITAFAQNFNTDGAAQFSKQGDLLQRYGHDNVVGVAVVPGNRVWFGGPSPIVKVVDIATGVSAGTISLPGLLAARSISYSPTTDTVLLVDTGNKAIFESTLSGNFIRRFDAPSDSGLASVTRGPGNDVFATDTQQRILHWLPDGTFAGSISTRETVGFVSGIVWAGVVPEPNAILVAAIGTVAVLGQRRGGKRGHYWGGKRGHY